MPAKERVGDAVDAGRVGFAAGHALDIAGLAVRLLNGAEETLALTMSAIARRGRFIPEFECRLL